MEISADKPRDIALPETSCEGIVVVDLVESTATSNRFGWAELAAATRSGRPLRERLMIHRRNKPRAGQRRTRSDRS